MAYSIEVKQKVLERIKNGEKIKDISTKTGISQSTLYNWEKQQKNKEILKKQETGYKVSLDEINVSKEIKQLIKLKKWNTAIKLTNKYLNNPIIQSQRITILINKKRFQEAKEIGEKFKDNAQIQSQMVTIAIKEEDFKTAKKIGKKFKEHAPIQSQMVTIAIKEEDFKKAKEIGEKFKDNAQIQSQMITIAIEEEDFRTAKEIGEKFKGYAPIQSQMITIAIEEEDFRTAKEIGEKFKDNAQIQSQMVTIAIKEGDLKTAREIGEKFKDNESIQSQMKTMAIKEGEFKTAKETEASIEKKELRTKIYWDRITNDTIDQIEQSANLDDYEKTIMLLAICEKRHLKQRIMQIIKSTKDTFTPEQQNILIKILNKSKSKKTTIFDMGFYDEILNWKFDENLNQQYLQEEKQKKSKQEKEIERKSPKEQSCISKPAEKNKSSRMQKEKTKEKTDIKKAEIKKNISGKIKIPDRKENISESNNKEQDKKIKYILKTFKNLKQKIYIKIQPTMDYAEQKKLIRQLDKIEDIIEKIKNKPDSEYIERWYKKLNKTFENGIEI